MKTVDIALSPCPNDTFAFHALVHGKIDTRGLAFTVAISDVEDLNRRALEGRHAVTKLSFHAWLLLKNRYTLLDSGSALGRGCGPLVVSRTPGIDLARAHIAIPGWYTTAYMLLRLWMPGAGRVTAVRFDEIMPGVAEGRFDAGLIIHEGRFVYPLYDLVQVIDLGEWWERETGLPIPLGCIAVRNDLAPMRGDMGAIVRASVEYARAHPADSRAYVKSHAQEMDDEVIDKHIGLYVNDFTLDLGDEGRKAVTALEEMARCRGILE
ncbi:MAG: 1,4-dihydroxy-6-naphthoate synthase [Spirochaetes bacterium]|nr:MAG: 1,4-dihydroxy-6-naphthoate synthase [Spirochaetota bacterium]